MYALPIWSVKFTNLVHSVGIIVSMCTPYRVLKEYDTLGDYCINQNKNVHMPYTDATRPR